ncbi:MAG: hypothetical protein HUU46_17825 [Candidatus Hydrogenedentes bacterium]|nr:hypothetical protein [Candidatus Hydrogenedentota bacterium]
MREKRANESPAVRLLPLYALLRRELLITLRTWRMALLVALVAGVCVIPVLASWPAPGLQPPGVYRGVSESIVSLVVTIVMGFGILGVTLIAAASFTAERDDDTLDMLAMTGLPPSLLVGAKILGLLALFGLLLVSLLPVVAAVYFHVGVDVVRVFQAAVLLCASAAACASIGVYCSIAFRNSYARVVAACAATFVVSGWILVPIIFAAVFNLLPSRTFDLFESSRYILPLSAASIALQPGTAHHGIAVLSCSALQLGLAATFWRAASSRLRKVWTGRGGAAARAHAPGSCRSRAQREIPDGANPIAFKELRYDLVHQRRELIVASATGFLLLIAVWLFVLSAYLLTLNRAGLMDAMIAFFAVQQVVIPAMFVPYCVQIVVKEYREGALDAIRMTALSGAAVLWGKVRSAATVGVFIVVLTAVAALPVSVPGTWPENLYWRQLIVRQVAIAVMGVATIGVCGLLGIACGFLAASCVKERQSCIALAFILYVNVLATGYAIASALRGSGFFSPPTRPHEDGFWVNACSPVLAFVASTDYVNGNEFVWEFWARSMLGFVGVGVALTGCGFALFARRYRAGFR